MSSTDRSTDQNPVAEDVRTASPWEYEDLDDDEALPLEDEPTKKRKKTPRVITGKHVKKPKPLKPRPQVSVAKDPDSSLHVDVWTPVGVFAEEVSAKISAEHGVKPVWDAVDPEEFEFVVPEMISSRFGLRCGFAARRPDQVIQVRPCLPRSLGSEISGLLAALEGLLSMFMARKLQKYVLNWTSLGKLHVSCVFTLLATLSSVCENRGFTVETKVLGAEPGLPRMTSHTDLCDFHANLKTMSDQREIKSLMVVRLYAVEREVFCSLAPAEEV